MNFKKRKTRKFVLLVFIMMMVVGLVGCQNTSDESEDDTYTVIYDGNGGYLGNKTYTIRKLEVAENSKIPKYLSEYTQDPYVVSSLGLAIRQGYVLKGWYLLDSATYDEDVNGSYVYLDNSDGNGYYQIDTEGDYVYGFKELEEGEELDSESLYLFIFVEPLLEDDDPDTTEYIYYEGNNGWGFYIYDEEDADHVLVYDVNDNSYLYSEISSYADVSLHMSELTEAQLTLFADVTKYKRAFYIPEDYEEGYTRYTYTSGYVQIDAMMVEDEEGYYIFDDINYVVYDSENPLHADLVRYSIDSRYVFTTTDTLTSPSELTKYSSNFVYWDFENDRVTEDMTLYAHWEKKLTVEYIQMSGQVTEITGKLNDEKTETIDFEYGETIGKLETIPLYAGYTFVGWSTSETEYIPWDFETDVFPYGTTTLQLYAYMIEGTYTRITNASNLAKVADDPDGNYILCNDIDLEGQIYSNETPLGFEISTSIIPSSIVPFTGEFKSFGYTISNYTLKVVNTQKSVNSDLGITAVLGLFPYVQDATIDGFTIEGNVIVYNTIATSTSVVCELGAAGLIGTALDGTTTVNDVHINVVFETSSDDVIDYPVTVGDIVAVGSEYVNITNSTAVIDYSDIIGITTSTLTVQTLD